jgi:hypothetical protein
MMASSRIPPARITPLNFCRQLGGGDGALVQIYTLAFTADLTPDLDVAQNPCAGGDDDVALDLLEAARVPVTAQLTAAAVQCKYEQLDFLRSFPAAFAANML